MCVCIKICIYISMSRCKNAQKHSSTEMQVVHFIKGYSKCVINTSSNIHIVKCLSNI